MIASHADLLAAYENGRHHSQRFLKNAGTTGDGQWLDWAFASGQPAFDARIGVPLQFTPQVAQGNDAIYFPPAPGMQRMLHKVTMRTLASGAGQTTVNFVLYDLIGVYPLIDGDSADTQDMDNTLTLPRYETGDGVEMVLVNHVAPASQVGRILIEYVDTEDVARSVDIGVVSNGANKVSTGGLASTSTIIGPLCVPLAGGAKGVKRVDRATFITPPGGLHAIYLIKPLAQFSQVHDALVAGTLFEKHAVEVDFALKDAWRMPVIKDGAHLSMFYQPNGSTRTVAMFGTADFIWG